MKELEAISGGALGGWLARFKSDGRSSHPAPPPGTKCDNCETELVGHFCHACGQEASDHHKSILHVTWEAIEGMFHFDGRLWRTLPWLFARPGTLSREYLDGKRARHVPPFRLFLVSLLLFILSAEVVIHRAMHDAQHKGDHAAQSQHGDAKGAAAPHGPVKTDEHGKPVPPSINGSVRAIPGEVTNDIQQSMKEGGLLSDGVDANGKRTFIDVGEVEPTERAKLEWFNTQLNKVVATPGYFVAVVFGWGHRLAVFLLPILALSLGACYFYRRKFYMYDHLIVSMNYLSFIFLLWAVVMILPAPVRDIGVLVALLWAPVNLFMTLRGVYGSNVFGALLKTTIVWFSAQLAFVFLLAGLLWLGLSQI